VTAVELTGWAGTSRPEDADAASSYTGVHVRLRMGTSALGVRRCDGGGASPALICHSLLFTEPQPAVAWTGVPGVMKAPGNSAECGHRWGPRHWIVSHDRDRIRTDADALPRQLAPPA